MAIKDLVKKLRGKVCGQPLAVGDLVSVPDAKWPLTESIPGVSAHWAIFVGMQGPAAMVRPIGADGSPGEAEPTAKVEHWQSALDSVARREFLAKQTKGKNGNGGGR